MIGDEAFDDTADFIKRGSRIYQTGANVAYTITSFVDITKSLLELIVDNTGKIGNALREAGVVLENSYEIMPEQSTAKTAITNKINS